MTKRCTDVFGNLTKDAASIQKRIHDTNTKYGGLSYDGSRVLFVNGKTDPW